MPKLSKNNKNLNEQLASEGLINEVNDDWEETEKSTRFARLINWVRLKSAVEILGVLKNAPKNDRTFIFCEH